MKPSATDGVSRFRRTLTLLPKYILSLISTYLSTQVDSGGHPYHPEAALAVQALVGWPSKISCCQPWKNLDLDVMRTGTKQLHT